MNDTRVLITGGAGFIGSRLANRLVRHNDVIVVDNQYLGDRTTLVDGVDYRDRSILDDDLPTDVDVVFHLAALSSITDHEQDMRYLRKGVEINVEGFVNVVEQARADDCDSVVYASSSAVYGSRDDPVTEDMPVEAQNAYAASKLARERYAEFFAHAYDMNMAGMRFFSVYREPPDPDADTREATNIITKLAEDIAHGRSPEVFGDGTHKRDFIHVDDIVRGLELAATHELTGVYNLGTGEQYRINSIIELLKEAFDSEVEPTYIENPIPEHMFIEGLVSDSSKMKAATGWDARIDIGEGIERIKSVYDN